MTLKRKCLLSYQEKDNQDRICRHKKELKQYWSKSWTIQRDLLLSLFMKSHKRYLALYNL